MEDVPEPRPVAEAPQLDGERRAMTAVLAGGDVGDVGFPAARVAAACETGAAPAPDGGWVLVAVVATLGRPGVEQPRAVRVRVGPIEHQHAGPALADGPLDEMADVRVGGLGERDR